MANIPSGTSLPAAGRSNATSASSVIFPALYVGLATGTCGVVYGSVVSTLIQSPNPRIYTTLAALQWAAAGTTFYAVRSTALKATSTPERRLHRVFASGLAGSFSGAVAAQFLPRGALFSGTVGFGAIAMAAQLGLDAYGDRPTTSESKPLMQRIAAWTPMKPLTDDEYEKILQQKLFKVEVEISLVDDQLAELRRLRAKQQERATSSESKDSAV